MKNEEKGTGKTDKWINGEMDKDEWLAHSVRSMADGSFALLTL